MEWALNFLEEFFVLLLGSAPLTQNNRHDRSVARRPAAAIGTVRQHSLQLTQLSVGWIDDDGHAVIAALLRRVSEFSADWASAPKHDCVGSP